MPISGLVLTLVDDRSRREAAIRSLLAHPNIQVGHLHEHRLPIVVDTISTDDDSEVWVYLNQLAGVQFVDLVCVQDLELNGVSHEIARH